MHTCTMLWHTAVALQGNNLNHLRWNFKRLYRSSIDACCCSDYVEKYSSLIQRVVIMKM